MRDPLTDFLLARIADDERRTYWDDDIRWALAQCAAHRQIVEEAFIVQAGSTEVAYIGDNVRKRAIYPSALAMLKALAAVYADHPDYRPEWKP